MATCKLSAKSRTNGKPAQVIERGDVQVEMLSDRELFAIIRGGLRHR